MRTPVKLLIAAAVAAGALTSSAAPALADDIVPVSHTVVHAAGTSPVIPEGGSEGHDDYWQKFLSISRWGGFGASTFHGRYDQFLNTDVVAASQRMFQQQTGMGMGNGAYFITQQLLDFALNLQPLNLLGAQADKVSAQLGEAILSHSYIVVAVVVILVGVAVFNMARTGQRPWKKIGTAAGLVALFAVMLGGASMSTTTAGHFQPGLFSPGWFATKINSSVTAIANIPSFGLTAASPTATTAAAPGSGCATYMRNNAADFSHAPNAPTQQIVASLWETTGLVVFKQVQFGTTPIDQNGVATYGDEVFCHQLDWQSGVTPDEQAIATFGDLGAARAAGYTATSSAWGAVDNNEIDRSMVAWAACKNDGRGHFSVRGAFADASTFKSPITAADCTAWWTGDQKTPDSFNVSGKASDVTDRTSDPAVRDFLLTMHGNTVNAGQLLIWTYGISAILMLIVFAGLSLAIILAKFAGVVMVVTIFFVLLISLMSKQDMSGKLLGFLRTYMGFTVFAFGANLILSLITVMSQMVASTASAVFTAGSVMALIFTGLAPLIGCFLLHLVFTRLFKLPSVFKPSSAFAWGAAGGAIGGSVAHALTQRGESGLRRTTRNIGSRMGSMAKSYALGKANGAPTNRRGTMAPSARPGTAAAAAAGTAGMSASTAKVLATVGTGAKVSGKKLDGVSFDPAILAEAKTHARGGEPAPAGASSKVSAAAVAGVRSARQQLVALRTPEARAQARGRAGETVAKAREALAAQAQHAKSVGELFRQDPALATGLVAENIGRGMRDSLAAGTRVVAAGTRAVADGHAALRSSPAMRSATGIATRVAAGAAVGTILGGPVGTLVGVGVGATRGALAARRELTRHHAGLVSNYLEHQKRLAEQEAERSEGDIVGPAAELPQTASATPATTPVA